MRSDTGIRSLTVLGALVCALGMSPLAGAAAAAADEREFRDLYRELVEINTTLSTGSCTEAATAMAARLRKAGMVDSSIQVLVPPEHPKAGSLIATYPGRDRKLKPVLLLAHIDVVEARREDWERDPFKLVEEGGFFYGRGSSDDKAMATVFTDSLVRFQRSGFKPLRDIRLALTCGEETSSHFNSVVWLLEQQPSLLQARVVLNEGAGGLLDEQGKPVSLSIQAGEKIYQDYTLEATHGGGHSSRPTRENPIAWMAGAITRLQGYQFPVRLNDTTRAYFNASAALAPTPQVAADMRAIVSNPADGAAAARLWTANPGWNGMLRTTCVTTEIDGGHAPNALPQRVRANVNCRILPDESIEHVRAELVRVIGDERISVKLGDEHGASAPIPALDAWVLNPVKQVAARIWPGVPTIPTMSTGATDGRFLNRAGIPTYGLSGMFHDAEGSRAHGLNERIRVQSLLDGRRFLHEVTQIYSQQKD